MKNKLLSLLFGTVVSIVFLVIIELVSYFVLIYRGPIDYGEDHALLAEKGVVVPSNYSISPNLAQYSADWQKLRSTLQKDEPIDCWKAESNGKITRDNIYAGSLFFNGNYIELAPNIENPHSQFILDDKVIYDVQYSTDSFGRRKTIDLSKTLEKKDKYLAFLGGSFVFGEGVNDSEHMASVMTKFFKKRKIYNYGVPGHGVSSTFAKIYLSDLLSQIPEATGDAILIYNDFDISRLAYTFQNGSRPYMKHQAILEEDGDGLFHPVSPLSPKYEARHRFYKLLGKSSSLKLFNIDFPILTRKHFDRYARVLVQLRDILREKIGLNELYLIIYPDNEPLYIQYLKEQLEKYKIYYIDISTIESFYSKMDDIFDSFYYPCDGHPKKEFYQLTTRMIGESLRSKIKE